jgi:hypothetical protein
MVRVTGKKNLFIYDWLRYFPFCFLANAAHKLKIMKHMLSIRLSFFSVCSV